MTTKNPRINVTVDQDVLNALNAIALQKNKSISFTANEIMKIGLEDYEDMLIAASAVERIREGGKTYSHEEAWAE